MKKIVYILILIGCIYIQNLISKEIEITLIDKNQINKINRSINNTQNLKIEKLDSMVNIDKKYVFDYDEKGRFSTETQYNLDYYTNSWEKNTYTEYFYNNFNQLSIIKHYVLIDNSFAKSKRLGFSFNNQTILPHR